jgi:hypothetical protein
LENFRKGKGFGEGLLNVAHFFLLKVISAAPIGIKQLWGWQVLYIAKHCQK